MATRIQARSPLLGCRHWRPIRTLHSRHLLQAGRWTQKHARRLRQHCLHLMPCCCPGRVRQDGQQEGPQAASGGGSTQPLYDDSGTGGRTAEPATTHEQDDVFLGVSRFQGSWRARTKISNRNLHLGMYSCKEDAARAYDAAGYLKDGVRGAINFPTDYSNLTPEQGTAQAKQRLAAVPILNEHHEPSTALQQVQEALNHGRHMPASTYQGVDRLRGVQHEGRCWRARCRVHCRSVFIGMHASEEAAARAYAAACYLRDACVGASRFRLARSRRLPFYQDYSKLTPEQGTAAAKDVLGPVATGRLMEALHGRGKDGVD